MNCVMCGAEGLSMALENAPLVGLRGVTLVDVPVYRCRSCGEYEVEIAHHEALMRVVTRAVLNERGRLVGREIRWLRSRLGWTGVELAQHCGVTPETVSKWENDRTPVSRTADRLLRLLATRDLPAREYPREPLRLVAHQDDSPLRLRLRCTDGGWGLDGPLEPVFVADPTREDWVAAVLDG